MSTQSGSRRRQAAAVGPARGKRKEADMKPAAPAVERRAQRRVADETWPTALTYIEPNKILLRGYPLDEMMGRLTFGESIYLLLMGEMPTPGIGRLMEAILVSFIDHGATPPSTLAARNTATTGAPLRACVAAGVLGFGRFHGGDIVSCMQFLDTGLDLVRGGVSYRAAAEELVRRCEEAKETPPGFGHRYHTRDPRAARLFQMALELEAEAHHIQMIRAVEMVMTDHPDSHGRPIPVNIDGAIAALCGDLGIPPSVADALFVISRVPGIAAHAEEERTRQEPMRQIDPKDHRYDGPSERRLPERRK
jgi:citrate synthase